MQVQIELEDEQIDYILAEGLKSAYETHIQFKEDCDDFTYEELNNAFKIMLQYFMLEKDYIKFMHSIAKVEKKYNSKRLAEAHGGL